MSDLYAEEGEFIVPSGSLEIEEVNNLDTGSQVSENQVDLINAALEQAEADMAAKDQLIERARRHLSSLEGGISPSVVYDASPKRVGGSRYEKEHELYVGPVGEEDVEERRTLKHDMQKHAAEEGSYHEGFKPSDGLIAYKVSVSDNLISLEEAVDIAVKNSMLLKSLKVRVKGTARKLTEARRAFFPTASMELSSSGGIVVGTAYQGESYQFKIEQPIFDGGQLLFTLKQAEASLESERAKYNKEKADLIHRVGEAYRGVITAEQNKIYQDSLYNEIQIVKDRTEKEFNQKLTPEVEYLEVLTVYNQALFQRESAISNLQSATLKFHKELSVDIDDRVPIEPTLEFREVPIDLEVVLSMVQKHNWEIQIKALAAKASYYALKTFNAKQFPKVDLNANFGMAGEAPVGSGSAIDLENEHGAEFKVTMPLGPNTTDYRFTRRFFAPTISSFLGSEDYKHKFRMFLFDKLGDYTDEEIAKADYLLSLAELKKIRNEQALKAQEAFYNYKGALLQMNTSLSRVKFREKQVNILKVMTGFREEKIIALLNEMVQLTDDRFEYIKAIADIYDAVSEINSLIGIEEYYGTGTQT